MNIDRVLTLDEIQLLIEDAHAAPIKENGTSDMWDMLPRIPYDKLPAELKAEADKITVEVAKRFLFECYPVGHFDSIAAEPSFNEKIEQALHSANYLVESTDLTPPEITGIEAVDRANYEDWKPISLIGSDFVEAWEKLTQDVGGSKKLAVKPSKNLPNIYASISKKLDLPMDKGNREFWDLMESTNGQYKIGAVTLANKDKDNDKDCLILIDVDMSANDSTVKLNRELTTYDKYLYMAVDALYRANESHTMTLTNIYKQLGNDKSPSSADIQKILASLNKMGNTTVEMNNALEREQYPNYPEINYKGKLLEFRQITVKANGKATDGAIYVLAELPLMTVARERKQFTTIDRKLLTLKMGKTAENLNIFDVLIDRIATIKSGHTNNKILYSYIYEHAKITTSKQRQRTPEKIRKILGHFKKCGHIKNYLESEDGITIIL